MRDSPADARVSSAAAWSVRPTRMASRAASMTLRTSSPATAESAWLDQNTWVTGNSGSPGRAERAPTTADPTSSAKIAATTANAGRSDDRRGADATRAAARSASSTAGAVGRTSRSCHLAN